MRKLQVVNITGCARCNGKHQKMIFKPFERESENGGWSHFGFCPKTLEPVFLAYDGNERSQPAEPMKADLMGHRIDSAADPDVIACSHVLRTVREALVEPGLTIGSRIEKISGILGVPFKAPVLLPSKVKEGDS